MATQAICGVTGLRGGSMNLCGRSGMVASSEMQGVVAAVRVPGLSLSSRLCSLSIGRSDWRAFGDGRQCVESTAGTSAAKNEMKSANACKSPRITRVASTSSREFEVVQAREWNPAEWVDDGALFFEAIGETDLRGALESFANTGDITEENMERLVELLLTEKGRSGEDYRSRANLFEKIAQFFMEGRAYKTHQEESPNRTAEVARAMQLLADVILAEDGRSATDYNARAQFFTRSAELFPFNAGVKSS